jgi:hypothetical protein
MRVTATQDSTSEWRELGAHVTSCPAKNEGDGAMSASATPYVEPGWNYRRPGYEPKAEQGRNGKHSPFVNDQVVKMWDSVCQTHPHIIAHIKGENIARRMSGCPRQLRAACSGK